MNPKLMALPIDALQQLKKDVDEAMSHRKYELFRVGKLASFYSAKKGREVIIRITKINTKTVMGDEVNERGIPTGMKWKCGPSCLTVLPDAPKVVIPEKGVGADAPESSLAGSF